MGVTQWDIIMKVANYQNKSVRLDIGDLQHNVSNVVKTLHHLRGRQVHHSVRAKQISMEQMVVAQRVVRIQRRLRVRQAHHNVYVTQDIREVMVIVPLVLTEHISPVRVAQIAQRALRPKHVLERHKQHFHV